MTLPAATLAEGPLGLEGLHTWNGVTLNNNLAFPRYKLTRITGIRSKPDSDDYRDPAKGSIGEITYSSQPRGKTIVYSGVIEATDQVSLRTAGNALMAAFAETKSEGFLGIAPPAGRGGVAWFAACKSLACDIDDEVFTTMQSVFLYSRRFTCSLRMSDPRFYSTVPVTISGASGATVVATNLGTAPSEPTFTLDGAFATGPRLERVGGSDPRFLDFNDSIAWPAIGAGQHLVVGFGRTPFATSPEIGGDFAALIDFTSNWWDDEAAGILPGANSILVTGRPWSMTFYPASW